MTDYVVATFLGSDTVASEGAADEAVLNIDCIEQTWTRPILL